MSYLDRDPSKPTSDLLSDISAAANQRGFPGLPLVPFGALLVKIAGEASETVADLKKHITDLNEKNAKLQWWVTALALAALISTLVQTGVAIASYRGLSADAQAKAPQTATATATATATRPTSLTAASSVPSAALLSAPAGATR